MARPRNHEKHIAAAIGGLLKAVTTILKEVHVAVAARPRVALAAPGEVKSARVGAPKRGPDKGNPRLKAALKASWANYTPAQRAARIAKMRAGHAKRKRRMAARK